MQMELTADFLYASTLLCTVSEHEKSRVQMVCTRDRLF